jgi:hypothetical protein
MALAMLAAVMVFFVMVTYVRSSRNQRNGLLSDHRSQFRGRLAFQPLPMDLVFDMTGVQRGDQDPETALADFEQAEKATRRPPGEEAEQAAEEDTMAGFAKIPALPPTNNSKHDARSTGVDVDHYIAISSTGLRTKSNSAGGNMSEKCWKGV